MVSGTKGYDWDLIKQDYCAGLPWSKIMLRHGVSNAALANHVRDDNWGLAKAEYQTKMTSEVIRRREDCTVRALVSFNQMVEEGCDLALNLVRNQIVRLARNEKEAKESKTKYFVDVEYLGRLVKVMEMAMRNKFKVTGFNPESLNKGDGSDAIIEGDWIDLDAPDADKIVALYNRLQRQEEMLEEQKIQVLREEDSDQRLLVSGEEIKVNE